MTRLARSLRTAVLVTLAWPMLLLGTVLPTPARIALGLVLVGGALWQLWALA
jgi:Zn-dependent membrane protease YugP